MAGDYYGFCLECWQVALAGDQEAAGVEADLAEDPGAGPAEEDLADSVAGAAEAEGHREVGKTQQERRG